MGRATQNKGIALPFTLEMYMVKYTAKIKMSLNVGTSEQPRSETIMPGDTLEFDGSKVIFKGFEGDIPSLQSAVQKGWLVPTPDIQDSEEFIAPTRTASSDNNAKQIFVDEGSPKRGMPVYENDEDGQSSSNQIQSNSISDQRKIGNTSRGKVASFGLEGLGEMEETGIPTRQVSSMITSGNQSSGLGKNRSLYNRERLKVEDEGTAMDEVELPLTRKVASDAGKIEVNTSTPKSSDGLDKTVYKNAGLDYAVTSRTTREVLEEVVPEFEVESTSSGASFAQKLQERKSGVVATGKPESKKVAAPVKVNGYTYEDMKAAGWTEAQLLASPDYKVLVPTQEDEAVDPITEVSSELPEGWQGLKLEEKLASIATMTSSGVLELLRTHKNSHYKVRNAAKEKLASLG